MAFVALPTDAPGICGPLTFRPETAKHLLGLAEAILRRPASLDQGDREAIAAWTSHRNGSGFCMESHAAAGASDHEVHDVHEVHEVHDIHDIHDTVLITAAFFTYNRSIDGIGTRKAAESDYEPMGRRFREQGAAPSGS